RDFAEGTICPHDGATLVSISRPPRPAVEVLPQGTVTRHVHSQPGLRMQTSPAITAPNLQAPISQPGQPRTLPPQPQQSSPPVITPRPPPGDAPRGTSRIAIAAGALVVLAAVAATLVAMALRHKEAPQAATPAAPAVQ